VIDHILDAAQAFVVNHVACHPKHKQIPQTLIKYDFGRHPRIRAADDNGEEMLAIRQFPPAPGRDAEDCHSRSGNYPL
jgi:hypothetical protein